VAPYLEKWDADGIVGRDVWRRAGAAGLLGLEVPEHFGGAGVADYRFRFVLCEELAAVGAASVAAGFSINDDIVLGYLLDLATEDQQARWLPGFATGETIAAIAMTEPGTGSDLRGIATTAVRDGDDWVLNGSKTFITNGIASDLVVAVARTAPDAGSGATACSWSDGTPPASNGDASWRRWVCTGRTPPSCSSTGPGYRGATCWERSAAACPP
jgi:acyl-CoA dehydrogenase